MPQPRVIQNPLVDRRAVKSLVDESQAFHRSMPGYQPTRITTAPGIAAKLGVRSVHVKDESGRMNMPSFKVLGASWATYRTILRALGLPVDAGIGLPELKRRLATRPGLRLIAATDGNHGRAVARMAALLGIGAHILVPDDMVQPRIDAIVSEGAEIEIVDGGYDDAIQRSADLADENNFVVSDTSWGGYVDPPGWVIDGYSTMINEILQEIESSTVPRPTVVPAQIGVGAFAAAVVRGFAGSEHTRLIGVEPTDADCMAASIEAGEVVTIPGPQRSIMAGLNCGTPSMIAWPDVSRGFDAFVTVTDSAAEEAVRLLYADGVFSGESGAAGLAGLLEHAAALGLGTEDDILLISTEGPTNVPAFNRITGAQLTEQGQK
ncbi:diaminopropionate ammonia-lyase [Saccharopolyspora sp. ASAGF58]|uniref:diaminopropionate ammonia-lyase n=1 Tax=Saccharopolyspora sp. ASAGF58 TaxID=2719023 RepID=UPI00143FFDDD|nr:diaminopropionate ammonia-lyase [Saccharopolyspora sp. ASAGF58]QIZ38628.1 diaminopropionate ammonia-lyase [Saccharopolyspora sp. ASAGF58]